MIIISVVLFLIVSLISCGEGADQKINLSKQELANRYQILISEKTKEQLFISNQLAKYLKLLTGKKVNILTSKETDILDGQYIILGFSNDKFIKDILGIHVRLKDTQGFFIKRFDDDIVIVANKPVGLIYGVYYFLENYIGFRFLSKDYTYIPETVKISLPNNLQEIIKPRFFYREIFIRESDNPDFSLKLRLNGRLGHRNLKPLKYGNIFVKLHDIFDLVPPKIYRKTHPEFFCGGQIDYTNSMVKEIALKRADQILQRYKNIKDKFYFVIGNADNGFYCTNKKSKERIKEGKAPSTPYLDFIVYLAKKLKKKYPNAIFTASAYLWSRKPPKNYPKLPDNVAVFFCDIESDFSKPIYKNREIYKDLKRWLKLSRHVIIWHYITNFNNYFQPYPNIYTIYENIKTYSRFRRIKGVFLQGSYGTLYGDMSDLRLYVFSKLLWNPKLDINHLIDDFIQKFYADAGTYIKEYLNLLYTNFKKHPSALRPKMIQYTPYLNAEFFIKAEEILNNALNSVPENSIFEKNIKKIKFSVDLMLLINNPYLQKEAQYKAIQWFSTDYLTKLKKEVKTFIKENNITTYSEGGHIKDILNLIELNRENIKYPEIVKNLTLGKDWFDYQEYMLQVCCGAKFEQDLKASDKVAVSMPGNTTAWGISLNLDFLPEGKWDIYFSIRVEPTDNYKIDDTAFRYGVYRKTRPKEVKLFEVLDKNYHIIHVGEFKKSDGNLWIAPPGNSSVYKIYVDRVFIIKKN